MSFGESAINIAKVRPGTIIGVINPRLMPKKEGETDQKYGNSFSIESEA